MPFTLHPDPSMVIFFLIIAQYHKQKIGINTIINFIYLISFSSSHLCLYITLCNFTTFVDSYDHQHNQNIQHFYHKGTVCYSLWPKTKKFTPYLINT